MVCPHWKPLITWSTRLCTFTWDNSVSVIKTEPGTRRHGNIIFNMTDKTPDCNTVTPRRQENTDGALSSEEMWKWNALPTESSSVSGTSITSCTFGPVSFTDRQPFTLAFTPKSSLGSPIHLSPKCMPLESGWTPEYLENTPTQRGRMCKLET